MSNAFDRHPELSIGGFFPVPNSGREVKNFNVGWRFKLGHDPKAETVECDDHEWDLVNLPHGLEILPLNASAGINYQGEAWYRKRFDLPETMKGKRVVLHFEGLMGKSRFFVNGELAKEHFGGYLPAILDITEVVLYGQENIIAVMTDNSDDPDYPPGKPQGGLDFSYFGGIYRDVWLITTDKVHITDPNEVDVVAGGGVFVHYRDVTKDSATVCVETHISNSSVAVKNLVLELSLIDKNRNEVATAKKETTVKGGVSSSISQELCIENPHLWHVDAPYLHHLEIRIRDQEVLDAVRLKIGIRSIEFRGREGFFLNGEPVEGKLIGANRHQDYAYVGNAVSNHAHWRDALRLRQAGMRVIRCAHYPQDPSFMDACDALGMFVIITTPGWQFWNKEPIFEKRVFSDIRNMVRRDRNRPSAWLWEPILNETNYPDYFAKSVHDLTHEEYPFPGCYTACDGDAAGQEHFDVVYAHPVFDWVALPPANEENLKKLSFDYDNEKRCVFTREWGDCVENWSGQSSPSRAPKGWGEQAQLVQAMHYADPDYVFTSYETLSSAPPQHIGGALWHGTDHQRGYHPDPFWGGILDAARQPKFSYQMFRSQLAPDSLIPGIETGPFLYIAHMMHPVSPPDVTVFSNCEEVRLSVDGEVVGCLPTQLKSTKMPHHPVVFKGAWNFLRKERILHAEGLIGGKVVVSATQKPWDRQTTIALEADFCGIPLHANGSDFIPIIARIVDKNGTVVRLAQDSIRFSVSGPAELIGADFQTINPQQLVWGEAVILVRAGTEPGPIRVRAETAQSGAKKPQSGELRFDSVASEHHLTFSEAPGH